MVNGRAALAAELGVLRTVRRGDSMRVMLAAFSLWTLACATARPILPGASDLYWRGATEPAPVQAAIRDGSGDEIYRVILRPLSSVEGGVVAFELLLLAPSEAQEALAGKAWQLHNLLGERPGFDEACRCYPERPFTLDVKNFTAGGTQSQFGTVRAIALPKGAGTLTWEILEVRTGLGAGGCDSCPTIESLRSRMSVAPRT
jgi:hypothetical protein